MAPLTVAKAAFAALPKTVTTFYYRGDAACHVRVAGKELTDGPFFEGHLGGGTDVSGDAVMT
jgi:hypothetical protein